MAYLTASLPKHLYGWVHKRFLTNLQLDGWERCIIHAVSCRPAQALTFTVLLESGAQYRGIPIHGLVLGQDPNQALPELQPLTCHQVWGCFGTEFHVVDMTFCEHLPCEWRDASGQVHQGRGLGWALEFHGDGYSHAPQQDKSFNMLVSTQGQLAAMPNNRIRWWENSFTDWSLPIQLRVNHQVHFVEQMAVNAETTAWVQD